MSTDTHLTYQGLEIWGGIECTINRVGDDYRDQLQYANHYNRIGDIEKFAALGIKKLRYPVLWELHEKKKDQKINWEWSTRQLEKIRASGMEPIAGLVHHGSGPAYTRLDDHAFPELLAQYAHKVATQFPWLTWYTPVNEMLTTARFSGLYGIWYPHEKSDRGFTSMLVNEVKATILSMQAIRRVNPNAKLIQTEDLSFIHSSKTLEYQAFFENHRRWLSLDLLCGKVDEKHIMYNYLLDSGITTDQLDFFLENPCPPDIIGFNYYLTSERYLDENIEAYPHIKPGTNGKHVYADLEAVRAGKQLGLKILLREAWERYELPLAITECHLACSRDEQLRWFYQAWQSCITLASEGVDIRALTVWAMLGAFDWNCLLTTCNLYYEPGAFDISNGTPRPTAIAKMVQSLATKKEFEHPVLDAPGWWEKTKPVTIKNKIPPPVLIVGRTGTLGNAFAKLCELRSLPYVSLSRADIDICSPESIQAAIDKYKPWAMINATGYVRVDDAETDRESCFRVNAHAPEKMAAACFMNGIRFVTFSTDLVFDGNKQQPYLESDIVRSLNVYGESKVIGENWVQQAHDQALVVRSSGFFGPWDKYNFVYHVMDKLKNDQEFFAAGNVIVSPTYVPDLVNTSLDLLIDEETGIWHVSNNGMLSWHELAQRVACANGFSCNKIIEKSAEEMNWVAQRPLYSVLRSEKGISLPGVDNALERYFHDQTA